MGENQKLFLGYTLKHEYSAGKVLKNTWRIKCQMQAQSSVCFSAVLTYFLAIHKLSGTQGVRPG